MRRTKEEAQKTREGILKSALDLFSEKGVAETSLQDIAKKAHVTRGAVYWHFESKAQIFDALHDNLNTSFTQIILDDLGKDAEDPLKQVKELCITLLLDLESNEEKFKTLTLFLSPYVYKGDLSPLREKHLGKKRESVKLFRNYFERAINQSHLPKASDAGQFHMALSCYMKGIINEYMNDPQTVNLKENARPLLDFFFNSMMK